MNRLNILLIFTAVSAIASAQAYYPDCTNVDMMRHANAVTTSRTEFVLPKVNGFNSYKADLHVHTIYSDAHVTPQMRVKEAWCDGLDVLAITDHIEYRPTERNMVKYLAGNLPEGTEIRNNSIITKSADAPIKSDLNYSVQLAQNEAKNYGITIIPGTEVTREPVGVGHYNALFTTDNNKIYDIDPLQSLRNAKAQNAIVMHNHPGWRRKSLDHPEFENKAYGERLIDGIEIMNGTEFYPRALDYAKEENLFVSSNTDIHALSADTYRMNGFRRNMTFIFASDCTLPALREAIEAHRTLAYSLGSVAGDEQLLSDLAKASLELKRNSPDRKSATLTNNTSLQFVMRVAGGNQVFLAPMSSIIVGLNADGKYKATIENFWTGRDSHPVIEFSPVN